MSQAMETPTGAFVDRRGNDRVKDSSGIERRQFANTYEGLSPDANELAQAIDSYKLQHRRRFIDFEEMLGVIKSLGYSR